MTSSNDRELDLERVLLGIEPEEGLPPEDRARLAALREENRRILAEHPPSEVAAEVHRRARVQGVRERAERRRKLAVGMAAFVPAAAALALVVSSASGPEPTPETVRLKGSSLLAYRKTAGGSELLRTGCRAAPGDVLQLAWQLDRPGFVALLSIDGRGVVTWHLPESPGQSARVEAGRGTLDHAYELDDAPRFERFFLVQSATPLDGPALSTAARRLAKGPKPEQAPLEVPDGATVLELSLTKEMAR